jgi:3-oxoacyl-[acyl-carrier protein] reductase
MRALVTGASGGIGGAAAQRLGEEGFDLAVHYRSHSDAAERVANSIRDRGREAFSVGADLEQPDEIERCVRDVTSRWDTLDLLVHNAGDYQRIAFSELTDEEFRRTLDVHVVGPAHLTRGLLPLLQRSAAPSIIFVSSLLAYQGSLRGAQYAAAKSAQIGLARSLAREYAPKIRVNVVAPGPVDTAILANYSPEQRAERARSIPLQRLGGPEDIAQAIAYLASPRASFVTGTTLHVNGGLRGD